MADFEHDAIQTCAADGTCHGACPVGDRHGRADEGVPPPRARRARARRVGAARSRALLRRVERAARAGLRRARAAREALGARRSRRSPRDRASGSARELVPTLPRACHRPAPRACPRQRARGRRGRLHAGVHQPHLRQPRRRAAASPRCPRRSSRSPPARAGRCGSRPTSPGTAAARPGDPRATRAANSTWRARTAAALWRWSDGGALPVVIDASSCALGLIEEIAAAPRATPSASASSGSRSSTRSTWVHDELLASAAGAPARAHCGAVHPTCSATHLGLADKLEAIAGRSPRRWCVPARARPAAGWRATAACCTPSCRPRRCATLALELGEHRVAEHLCSNRTCEIGLQEVTGAAYASFVLLLEQATRPAGRPGGGGSDS